MFTRICSACSEKKPISEFNRNKSKPGGYTTQCKDCVKAYRDSNKEYYSNYNSQYRKRYPHTYQRHLKYTYGLSPEQYESLATQQSYLCLICNKEAKLVVDHCHSTGQVRGLLCQKCNTALGKFNEDTAILRRAIAYLEGELNGENQAWSQAEGLQAH